MRAACLSALCLVWAASAAAQEQGSSGEGADAAADPAGEGEQAGAGEAAEEGGAEAAAGEDEMETETSVPVEVFEQGVAAYKRGAEGEAAARLYTYLEGNDPVAENYEWAEFYLAKDFARMGLNHAAVEYFYNVAKEQKRPELLPDALRSLEEILTSRPYDRKLVIDDLLGSSRFGTLPPDVQTFVAYHKGLRDLSQGRAKWAERHFAVLDRADPKKSPFARRYIKKARFARALTTISNTHDKSSKAEREARAAALDKLQELARGEGEEGPAAGADVEEAAGEGAAQADDEGGFLFFQPTPDEDPAALDLRNDAWRTVARLHYEEGRFDHALAAYENIEVPFLSRAEADLFLEKAWARYFDGDHRGTLGILLSLEAPSYRRHFRPERFILKALAYEALCHYAAAKGAAREFLRRYGSSLDQLRRTRDPLSDPVIRRAVVARPKPKRVLAYLGSLKRERERVEGLDEASGLRAHLVRMYDLKIAEVSRRLDNIVREEGERVAEELLDYEEQARLLDYEVSLEVFRRLKKGSGKKVVDKQEPIPLSDRQVYYEFNGEYWNDELHNYRFRIENRCFGEKLFR